MPYIVAIGLLLFAVWNVPQLRRKRSLPPTEKDAQSEISSKVSDEDQLRSHAEGSFTVHHPTDRIRWMVSGMCQRRWVQEYAGSVRGRSGGLVHLSDGWIC